jgi:hypothetical protein
MSIYQMPMFDRYPIDVEFDRHRRYIRQAVGEYTGDVSGDHELVEKLGGRQWTCPLNLFPDEMYLVQQPGAEYEACVPYAGDDELWRLYPGNTPLISVDGEVFRRHLRLFANGQTSKAAGEAIAQQLQRIQAVIDAQAQRIEAFEESVVAYVEGELRQMRRLGLQGRPAGSWTH